PQGKGKLSKRDGDKMGFPVFPLEWRDHSTGEISKGYREENYLPSAVVNMLSFLGWNPGTEQEFFNLEELIQAFDISRVHKSGAKFDPEKTKWFQQHYLQLESNEQLASQFIKILEEKGITSNRGYVTEVIGMLKERAVFIGDFWDLGSYFFITPAEYDPQALKKVWKEDTSQLINQLSEIISSTSPFSSTAMQEKVKAWIQETGIGFGKVMQPFRLSLVGAMQGPDVFEIAGKLGKEETVSRLNKAAQQLG